MGKGGKGNAKGDKVMVKVEVEVKELTEGRKKKG